MPNAYPSEFRRDVVTVAMNSGQVEPPTKSMLAM